MARTGGSKPRGSHTYQASGKYVSYSKGRLEKSFRDGTDWRSENIRKKAEARRERLLAADLRRRRAAAVSVATVATLEREEIAEAVTGNPELRERIGLLAKKHAPTYSMMTPEEKAIAVELHHEGVSRTRIAQTLGRTLRTVSRFLERYTSTTTASRLYFEANADKLARRIVRNANVDQSLEVMDRLDVLPVQERGKSSGGSSFNVMIGVPGSSAIPVPAQRDIDVARSLPAPAVPPAPSPPAADFPSPLAADFPRVSPIPIDET